jgi:hypothetical protein
VLSEEIKSAKQARLEIVRLYEEDPEGWHIFLSRDNKGYYNTSVVHRSDFWLIKEEVINPYEVVGYALKTTLQKDLGLSEEISFGLRPLQGRVEDVEVVLKAMLQKPLPPSKITSPYVAEGPYIISTKLSSLAPSQSELEKRLSAELDRLTEKRYSYLRRIYG